MTIAFPISPAMRARRDALEDISAAARAILRSEAEHTPSDIRWACHNLMIYGNSFDWLDGYHVLRALDAPKPAPVKPPYSPQVGTVRDGLLFLAFVAAVLVVGLAG
jgi:hypothetical protein